MNNIFSKFKDVQQALMGIGQVCQATLNSMDTPRLSKIAKLCPMRPPRRTADPWGRVCATNGSSQTSQHHAGFWGRAVRLDWQDWQAITCVHRHRNLA